VFNIALIKKQYQMKTEQVGLQQQIQNKAKQLGIWEDALVCALDIIHQNRNLVNAMDIISEMDEYIYRAIIKQATENRKARALSNIKSGNAQERAEAEKDLTPLRREELITDPYYRAVLPTIVKLVGADNILKLHAEEASEIVFKLADFKAKHRSTSVTKIIVTNCRPELENFDSETYTNLKQAS
jgi:hypothetical protein